jgi:uncharacterized flavoprotein (TIGR03862 family)
MSAAGNPAAAPRRVVVVGGGPAGLMAAECALDAGAEVRIYEQMPSVARKFLIAGKGGLNLTHSEPFAAFVARYGARSGEIGHWLAQFDADALRRWALDLGYPTVIGSSGRVFPADFKAGPLLRAWVRRIRGKGVVIHTGHRWLGWSDAGALRFAHGDDVVDVQADAVVLALGGASWSALGSDGRWTAMLAARGVHVAPLRPANCGFECAWSRHLIERHAGAPIKSVRLRLADDAADAAQNGEFVITAYGVEGSAIYALSARLRDAIDRDGAVGLIIDLAPHRSEAQLVQALSTPRGKRTRSEHLRRATGIEGARSALLHECIDSDTFDSPLRLAQAIKALPLRLLRTRPLDEAISSAGGVRFEELTADLMLRQMPGVWCAGEMIDWEAPTGGYLLTACFASGYIAGRAAAGAAA